MKTHTHTRTPTVAAAAFLAIATLPGCDHRAELHARMEAEARMAELEARRHAELFSVDEPAEVRADERFDVVNVVDGDTIHILRNGGTEKLRLLSVDTEEKITGRPSTSTSKPETVFGQETAIWAREVFEELAEEGRPPRVALVFPAGKETRDVYGRLLCHVILPDGTDFNLRLVQLGKSPYFNKYGNSRICHDELVAAQAKARAEKLGVWNPETNRPKTPGAPAARRPYDKLLPWWQARADAIDGYRAASAESPGDVIAADEPAALRAAQERCAGDPELRVRVFGELDRLFDEDDGSLTVLFRSSDRRQAFRAGVSSESVAQLKRELDLQGRLAEFRQSFFYVEGALVRGERGFRMEAGELKQWKLAGPEPKLPK